MVCSSRSQCSDLDTTSCSLTGGSQRCRARHRLHFVVFDLLTAVL
jgi:hypothetical protein